MPSLKGRCLSFPFSTICVHLVACTLCPCQCRVGSYRLRGKCAKCPNTAWLLFFSFSLAIVACVAAAVYLSKKRINMAGLSIGVVSYREHCSRARCPLWPDPRLPLRFHTGAMQSLGPEAKILRRMLCVFFRVYFCLQDFLQVLSMFAGFGFDWPPAIRGIYNLFSLLNFNFELLAPECSVSLNFETKW